MSEKETFGIDFSEAKTITNLPVQIQLDKTSAPSRLETIWGFSAEKNHTYFSGPCALGTVFYFYGIGWNHLPKRQNGRPVNDAFISEIMRWSKSPDLPKNTLGTSPATMLRSLQKAGLTANWYAASPFEYTWKLIEQELQQDRPVIALVNHQLLGKPLVLEWQVIFRMTIETVHTKHCAYEDAEFAWPLDKFRECLKTDSERLDCSIITAQKE